MIQHDLSRFKEMHKLDFETALSEIRSGRKTTHWMWYIFPQIQGLGRSDFSKQYAIKNISEAKEFLNDTYLGNNLISISNALLELKSTNATEIFGRPDDKKLKSSMTLFAYVADGNPVFKAVLDKFFDGKQDYKTLIIIKEMQK